MIKVYQIHFPRKPVVINTKFGLHMLEERVWDQKILEGNSAGDQAAPGSHHRCDRPHRSQGRDLRAVDVCPRKPRLDQHSAHHTRSAKTNRRNCGVTQTPRPREHVPFLSKD
jgi:hypothetical protein